MARVCAVCGKGPTFGNNVSHANNKTIRRWYPNLQVVRTRVDGTVKRIRKSAQTVSNVVTYMVEVSTANPEKELLPGMTATVDVRTGERVARVVPTR